MLAPPSCQPVIPLTVGDVFLVMNLSYAEPREVLSGELEHLAHLVELGLASSSPGRGRGPLSVMARLTRAGRWAQAFLETRGYVAT